MPGPLREQYMRRGPLREQYMRRRPLREEYNIRECNLPLDLVSAIHIVAIAATRRIITNVFILSKQLKKYNTQYTKKDTTSKKVPGKCIRLVPW